jgi:hypothetical protein
MSVLRHFVGHVARLEYPRAVTPPDNYGCYNVTRSVREGNGGAWNLSNMVTVRTDGVALSWVKHSPCRAVTGLPSQRRQTRRRCLCSTGFDAACSSAIRVTAALRQPPARRRRSAVRQAHVARRVVFRSRGTHGTAEGNCPDTWLGYASRCASVGWRCIMNGLHEG